MRTQQAKSGLTHVPAAERDVMRAIVQDVHGSADRLRLSEIGSLSLRLARSWCRCVQPAWTGVRAI